MNGPTVNGLEWAYGLSQGMLSVVSYGPIVATEEYCRWLQMGPLYLQRNAANSLEWAHGFSEEMLPMVSYGPIVATEEYCQRS